MPENPSEELYKDLLAFSSEIKEFTKNVKTYPSKLTYADLNTNCYEKMYLTKPDIVKSRKDFFTTIPGLESECNQCWKFHLSPRNKSIVGLDVQLGKKFQIVFTKFLNTKLKKGLSCVPADNSDKRYPDLKVVSNGEDLAYLELKYQSAPFIFAFKQPDKRECYEGSAALDVKKLNQQWELKESGTLLAPILYVFWLDFPCVKGAFFMTLEEMREFFNASAAVFKRKVREGDFLTTQKGKRLAAELHKIHPSIYQMHSLEQLIKFLEAK